MAASDILKTMRGKADSPDDKSMGGETPNEAPRTIKLSDDEQQAFADVAPGQDLACEVHGTLEANGNFHVMSVSPLSGDETGDESEQDLASQVAQRVSPNVQPSPS